MSTNYSQNVILQYWIKFDQEKLRKVQFSPIYIDRTFNFVELQPDFLVPVKIPNRPTVLFEQG